MKNVSFVSWKKRTYWPTRHTPMRKNTRHPPGQITPCAVGERQQKGANPGGRAAVALWDQLGFRAFRKLPVQYAPSPTFRDPPAPAPVPGSRSRKEGQPGKGAGPARGESWRCGIRRCSSSSAASCAPSSPVKVIIPAPGGSWAPREPGRQGPVCGTSLLVAEPGGWVRAAPWGRGCPGLWNLVPLGCPLRDVSAQDPYAPQDLARACRGGHVRLHVWKTTRKAHPRGKMILTPSLTHPKQKRAARLVPTAESPAEPATGQARFVGRFRGARTGHSPETSAEPAQRRLGGCSQWDAKPFMDPCRVCSVRTGQRSPWSGSKFRCAFILQVCSLAPVKPTAGSGES